MSHTRKNKLHDFVVAIPSYKRADTLKEKTLPLLHQYGIEPRRIHIFVANKEEEKVYKEALDPKLYGKIIVGVKGIGPVRNFIYDYFPVGKPIVSMDDDVEELQQLRGTTKENSKLIKLKDLDGFFKDAYKLLKQEKLFIWGVYPVRNAFFMQQKITTELKFIIGVTFGYINRKLKALVPKAEGKEDIEQSILYYLMDGGVIRFNNIVPKTKFNAPGGLGTDRQEMNRIAAEYLKKKYPDIVTIFYRKNGMTEVKLARMPRKGPPL
jgi:hypothetical protein